MATVHEGSRGSVVLGFVKMIARSEDRRLFTTEKIRFECVAMEFRVDKWFVTPCRQ
jgi:hypothetical protein